MIRRKIGERRKLLVIEIPLDTPDGFGGFNRAWQSGPAVWGALEPLQADERRIAGHVEEFATHRVHLRRRNPPPPGARFALGPRRFRIRATQDAVAPARDLICLVEEIKP